MATGRPRLPRGMYVVYTALRLALDAIAAHKLRSFLTLLGVIIGVASVVLVGSAIRGLGTYAEVSTARAFGTDSYLVAQIAAVGNLTRKEVAERLRKNKRFRAEDVTYLRESTGDSILYSPYRNKQDDAKAEDKTYEGATIIGASATLPDIRDVALIDGRFFTDTEERHGQSVCVIGDEIKTTLFPDGMPLGRKLKIRGQEFTVIGVQEKLGSAFGNNQDNSIYIPTSVWTQLYGTSQGMAIFAKARPDSGLSLEQSLDVTRVALRSHFGATPGKSDPFDTLTPDSIRSFTENILGAISVVVVPVTCISLLVGGIVIMNIMLVSVTERTREIGIRKALGAKRFDIMLQFLLESVVLAAIGGAIGLLIGWLATLALSAAFGLTLTLTLPYVILALVVSSSVGIISGWYPASRAAKLDPIVAVRSE